MVKVTDVMSCLDTAPRVEGFASLSPPRRFAHDEAKYDQQYMNEVDRPEVGRGVVAVARAFGCDCDAPALEIGCGTGLLSVGLAEARAYPAVVLSDPSPAFLAITQRKIARARLQDAGVHYAVLDADDLSRLPEASLSLVVLRSALHHVLDWERLIGDAAAVLRPGGVLAFQEPCADGYVVMSAMAQFFPLVIEREAGFLRHLGLRRLTRRHREQVRLFIDSVRFGARRDVDKAQAEDKHLFRVNEVVKAGKLVGLDFEFLPNTVFEDCVTGIPPPRRASSFFGFFRDYLKYCMSFDADLVARFERHFEPYCRVMEELSQTGDGPYMHGVFVGRRIGR